MTSLFTISTTESTSSDNKRDAKVFNLAILIGTNRLFHTKKHIRTSWLHETFEKTVAQQSRSHWKFTSSGLHKHVVFVCLHALLSCMLYFHACANVCFHLISNLHIVRAFENYRGWLGQHGSCCNTKTGPSFLKTRPRFSNTRPSFSNIRPSFWFSIKASKARPSVWKARSSVLKSTTLAAIPSKEKEIKLNGKFHNWKQVSEEL